MTDVSIEDGENISELLVFWPTTDSKKEDCDDDD